MARRGGGRRLATSVLWMLLGIVATVGVGSLGSAAHPALGSARRVTAVPGAGLLHASAPAALPGSTRTFAARLGLRPHGAPGWHSQAVLAAGSGMVAWLWRRGRSVRRLAGDGTSWRAGVRPRGPPAPIAS